MVAVAIPPFERFYEEYRSDVLRLPHIVSLHR